MQYYKLGILLFRKCNQTCKYCNNYKTSGCTYIDIDRILYILDTYIKLGVINIYLEFSGGEPALSENLDELLSTVYGIPEIAKIDILSNGLFRKKYSYLLDKYSKLKCIEHVCKNIVGKDINYFYTDITPFNNTYNNVKHLIVLDETTINSLINNFYYFLDTGLFDSNIDFKIISPKINTIANKLLSKYDSFSKLLVNNKKNKCFKDINNIHKFFTNNNYYYNFCCKNSIMQYIDLENDTIGQCSMNVEQSQSYEINEKNIKLAIHGKLFTVNDMCYNCIRFDKHSILRQIKSNQINNKNIYNICGA